MLTQIEADYLLNLLKKVKSEQPILFPPHTKDSKIEVVSKDGDASFIIDINRKGNYKPQKCTFQTRYQSSIILLRLDLDGPDHTNPDGTCIPCPHIHVYREGFHHSWAFPLPEKFDGDLTDLVGVFIYFLEYNKVNELPIIQFQSTLF